MPLCAPNIVYQAALLAQTADISNQTIFTASGSGLFRVTATIYVTAAPSPPNTEPLTNVAGVISTGLIEASCNFSGYANYSTPTNYGAAGASVFSGYSGQAVTLSTTMTAESGAIESYSVYVTIEQLQ